MKGIEYDMSQTGFLAVLKDWQLKAMHVVWGSSEGAISKTVWVEANKALKTRTISRASVIYFLEDMREMGVLSGEERTGKGGHHWVYKAAMDEAGFKRFVATTLLESLVRDFSVETRKIVSEISLKDH